MVYCFLADGFEELEAIAPIDMLLRSGVDVKTVGIGADTVKGSHGISVVCDLNEKDVVLSDELEGIILPGGMPGTLNLEESETVQKAIDFAAEKNLLICAICAAPSVLGHKGILKGKKATAFPGFENDLEGAVETDSFVVRDGQIITARGAGVALEFGLEIVAALKDKDTADNLSKTIQRK